MTKLVIPYKPQPRQSVFHKAKADEILYGGAAGGGKSEATIMDAFKYAMMYPKSKQIIFRRTFPDLQRSIINRTLQVYPKELARYHSQSHTWRFITGSTVELAHWDSDKDYMKYQGAEYDCIRWEELTQFEEKWYVYMLSRLRGANDYPKSVKSTSNPGGIGHSWVKKRFITVGPAEMLHVVPKTDDQGNQLYHPQTGEPVMSSVIFIPANVYDNPALLESDPGYLMRLLSLPDQERRQLLDGDWDTFAGQYFPEFSRSIHVIQPFDIPADWNRYRAMDEGYKDPFVCLWFAVDKEGNAYLYREFVRSKLLTTQQVEAVKERSPSTETIRYTVADTSFWNKSKTEDITPADIFSRNRIPLKQAKKERVNGWKRVREWLQPKNVADKVNGNVYKAAKLRIFANCLHTIEAIPSMIHDDVHPEDMAAHELDHTVDALRYFAMSTQGLQRSVYGQEEYVPDDSDPDYGSSFGRTGY